MYPPLVPSQRNETTPFPTVGMSQPTQQVEVSAVKSLDPDADELLAKRELIKEAMERFEIAVTDDQEWRRAATEELSFCDNLRHWSDSVRADREGLPCMVFDKIGPAVAQVVNDARQSPPEPRVSPVGNGADKDLAELIQGLLRNIDQDSSAPIAYMTGYEHAVKVGRGWWRVGFEWESDGSSFEVINDQGDAEQLWLQKVVIKRMPNPFSVYPDPSAQEFDYSDMKFCFVTEDVDRTTFEEEYPEAHSTAGDFPGLGISDKQRDEWFPKGAVRVAEYWRVETDRVRIARLNTGETVPFDQVPEGAIVASTRWLEKRTVKCAKITGAEVLKDVTWPGKWIPLVPCLGREILDNGKRKLTGMIRPAMDANLSYDYMRSRQVQAVGLATLAPYLVPEGGIEGFEQQWADANRKPVSHLPYKIMDSHGNLLPKPERNPGTDASIAAITAAVEFADNDCKSTLSTYDESLGKQGPESSGRAIILRQKEGDNAHFNYHDNLGRSIRHTARIELDLVPHIYSEARIINIVDPDGSTMKQVAINQPTQDKNGRPRIFHIAGAARCDVTIGSGPSYASRRDMQTQTVLQLTQTQPAAMARTLDLVAGLLDLSPEFQDRLRPPDVQKNEDGQVPIPPQAQQMLQQQGQLIQVMSQQLNQLSEDLKTKRLELESKERMNTQNNAVKLITAEALSRSEEVQHLATLDHDAIRHTIDTRAALLHNDETVEEDAGESQTPKSGEPAPQQSQPSPQGQMVNMRAPDGTVASVPAQHVDHYQSLGAQPVQ